MACSQSEKHIAGKLICKIHFKLSLSQLMNDKYLYLTCSYDALQYPLLLPYGEDGYSLHMKTTEGITSLQFYSFMAIPRSPLSVFFKARDLAQMYFTDMGVKVQTERLLWFRLNQKTLRAEQYVHLRDSVNTDGHAAQVQREAQEGDSSEGHGQLVVLPSSFAGSPRYLHMR